MIDRIEPRHDRMDNLIHYLFGEGRYNEHVNQRVVASADGIDVDIGRMISMDERLHLLDQMTANRVLNDSKVKDVWHMSLSVPSTDREMTDSEWAEISRGAMNRLGFDGPGRSPCDWVAVRHGVSLEGNHHVHIAVSVVREDGSIASDKFSKKKMSVYANKVERKYGLTVIDRGAGSTPGLSQRDLEHADRNRLQEAERLTLGRRMRGAAAAASSEADYVQRLKAGKVSVRPRIENDEVVGYSAALEDSPEQLWFKASAVDRQLGINKVRDRTGWPRSSNEVEDWLGERSSVSSLEMDADLKEAAAKVSEVAAGITGDVVGKQENLGALAADLSGIYAVVSERLEPNRPGPAAAASDTLARTANIVPRPAGRSDALSGVAAVAATAKLDGPTAMILLLARLAELSEIIQEQHRIRDELQRAVTLDNDQQQLIDAASETLAAAKEPAIEEPKPHLLHESQQLQQPKEQGFGID